MNIKKYLHKLENNKKIEYIAFFVISLIVSLLFAYKTGLIESGYHFADDHEIIDMNLYINNNGLLEAIRYYVLGDLVWRFRPLNFLLRVILVGIFKTNFVSWHIFRAVGISLIVSLSYILARKLKTPFISSVIFSFIFLIGTQDEIIWRLGTQENLGIFFLALSMIFVVDYYEKKQRKYGILASVSTILMIMSKESFLLMGPSIIIFLFYLYLKDKEENEFENIFIQLWDFIKEYKWFIIVICSFLLLSAIDILFYTGLYESGYAGIDTSYSIGEYIRLTINVFIRYLKNYWIVFIASAVLLLIALIKKILKKEISRQYLRAVFVGIVFAEYSLCLQCVIYGSSGMLARYYLPCVWVLYFIVVVMENTTVNKYIQLALVIVLLFISSSNLKALDSSLEMDAEYFARSGRRTTDMLDYVGTLKDKKSDLVVGTHFTWYEHDYSSSIYLQNEKGISEVYYIDDDKEDGDYKKIYNEDNKRVSVEDVDVFITDREDEYDLDSYIVNQYSNLYVLEKK